MRHYDKHKFHIKGLKAEEALNKLAFKSFLKEWCYPNPKRWDGKEICDLLVLFDNQMIIIQLKDIKFTGNDERYLKKAIEDPCKQIQGAERTLFELNKPVFLTNPYGHTHQFDPKSINHITRIVVTLGDGDVLFNAIQDIGKKNIHIIDRSIEVLLDELDTISDFTKYLIDKESFILYDDLNRLMASREIDLLGVYIFDGKSFDQFKKVTDLYIEYGIWEEVTSRPEYIAKQKEDEISYFWDFLIELSHECPGDDYREIARELSKLDRFKRRCASFAFFKAHDKAIEGGRDFRRVWKWNGVTYVFLFTPPDRQREQRVAQLNNVCIVARNVHKDNPQVIGIASEFGRGIGHSYDFVYLDFPEWTNEDQKLALSLQEEYAILKNPDRVPISIDEYPIIKNVKVGRNDPCPCGSGKKYKKCHGRNPN
ncbi:MAG: SEC-C domain-containing protein [candidate division Zixibacteria bacterium]|nr:SEC-C domain-containing protein [candidate division Zixibacteria bacterium]